jgi:sirohydrochlorin ferrochelatase
MRELPHETPGKQLLFLSRWQMKTIVILAMHGSPPKDFPPRELGEFFGLHARMESAPRSMDAASRERYAELDHKIRSWKRTPENDPFYAGSLALAGKLAETSGMETRLAFNEFCDPALDEAVRQAVAEGASRIVVVTPMMTAGGEHAEREIPAELERMRGEFPGIDLLYAWPFASQDVAAFLTAQVRRFLT